METLSHATLKDVDEVSCAGGTFSGNFAPPYRNIDRSSQTKRARDQLGYFFRVDVVVIPGPVLAQV